MLLARHAGRCCAITRLARAPVTGPPPLFAVMVGVTPSQEQQLFHQRDLQQCRSFVVTPTRVWFMPVETINVRSQFLDF